MYNKGIRYPRQRADVDAVRAGGRVLLGAAAAAGHDAVAGEAVARREADPGDGARRRHGHAHRRPDHQGYQRRAAEAAEHLHGDPHAAAAAIPGRAH